MINGKRNPKFRVKVIKKNAKESEAFRSNFHQKVADAIEKKQSDYHTIRLFSQDETRYGLLPIVHRRITLTDIKPVAEIDYSFTAMSIYGAVDSVNGDHFFLEFPPQLNAACFQIFINQFSATLSESLNVIVLENGRFHHAKILEIPDNVILLFLPPYSPELNPIERLWQELKAKLFCQCSDTLIRTKGCWYVSESESRCILGWKERYGRNCSKWRVFLYTHSRRIHGYSKDVDKEINYDASAGRRKTQHSERKHYA